MSNDQVTCAGLPNYGTVDRSEKYHRPDAHHAATLDRPSHQRAGSVPFADTENDRDLATTDNPAYQPAEVGSLTICYLFLLYVAAIEFYCEIVHSDKPPLPLPLKKGDHTFI